MRAAAARRGLRGRRTRASGRVASAAAPKIAADQPQPAHRAQHLAQHAGLRARHLFGLPGARQPRQRGAGIVRDPADARVAGRGRRRVRGAGALLFRLRRCGPLLSLGRARAAVGVRPRGRRARRRRHRDNAGSVTRQSPAEAEVPKSGGDHACWRSRKKNRQLQDAGVMFGENAPAKRSAIGATCDACVASEKACVSADVPL